MKCKLFNLVIYFFSKKSLFAFLLPLLPHCALHTIFANNKKRWSLSAILKEQWKGQKGQPHRQALCGDGGRGGCVACLVTTLLLARNLRKHLRDRYTARPPDHGCEMHDMGTHV